MKLINSVSRGFLVFILLYISGVVIAAPFLFELLNVDIAIDLRLFAIPLAAIVHNAHEMYGGITIWGVLSAGVLGGILNYTLFLLLNRKHA
ncbi:hypothetical protein SAMN04489762_3039 [Terribacillus saccharophilus]|uniref:QueT transporter family protein n=1 Tax=Terribacillus saccharophilus TaxID=361277 RepID=A0AAX2EIN6_9BACI|nr:hypothetical protein SAMN04489762_3039 [Terribacillus saccharophilus]